MQNEVIEDYSYSKTPVQIPFHTRFDIWIDFGLNLSEISESLSFDLQGFKKPTTQNLTQVILNLRLVLPTDPLKRPEMKRHHVLYSLLRLWSFDLKINCKNF